MKIISLTAENIKKLSVVEIKPDGNMVLITGKNGAGKTSVLDAIWWALSGATHIQTTPIRKGATEARIRLDLGDIVVTRTFRSRDDQPATSTIVVESADGFRANSPQKLLDSLLGALSFDPLAFTRMEPRQQFDALRQFVPGVDFDKIDKANKADFTTRQDLNRQAKQARAAAGQIVVPSELPTEFVDEDALTEELAGAGEHNANIETRKARRKAAADKMAELRAIATQTREGVTAAVNLAAVAFDRTSTELGEEIKRLEKLLVETRNRLEANVKARQDAMDTEATNQAGIADQAEKDADGIRTQIDTAPALPELIDTAALTAQMADARRINDGIRQRNLRDRQTENAATLETEAKALTTAMDARTKAKADAVAGAAMPVPGIGFGDGAVTLNDLPFDQASDAEQLRASIAIAMASNPKLRVIRVRDGSLLDEDGMRLLADMADASDYQVWIEKVDGSGKVGFVLEDGHLRQPDLLAAE